MWGGADSAIQEQLKSKGVYSFYHFTDRRNLRSIVQSGGLLSWKDCLRSGVRINKPGGSDVSRTLDEKVGLESYVRVSFVRDNPMMYVAQNDGRIDDPVVLKISTEVAGLPDVLFSDRNAASTKKGFLRGGWSKMKSHIRFNVFNRRYFDLDEDDRPYYQAEVLVPHKIPLRYITKYEKFMMAIYQKMS